MDNATMQTVLGGVGVVAFMEELQLIAECCNKSVDCFMYKKGRKARGCRSRGTHKHTCCKNAVDRSNYKDVATEKQHNMKPACRPDVRVPQKGKVKYLFDFKFNCSREPFISDKQISKYKKRYGVEPIMIPARGNPNSTKKPDNCSDAKRSEKCP